MRRRLLVALATFGLVVVFGTVGYIGIEHWRLLDSIYMTVTTITTVGFGEVHPLSDGGRLFTIVLALTGLGSLGYVLASLTDFLVEGHLQGLLEERRMERTIAGLKKHRIVAGLGRVGSEVAGAFAAQGEPFVVIDNSAEPVAVARDAGWLYVSGDATDETVLEAAGIDRAVSLVTTLDTDAANVYVTLTARTRNPELFIVARSSAETSEDKLRKAGADRVITPTAVGGRRMASMVLHPFVSDYLDLVTRGQDVEFRLEEIELKAGSPFVGRTVGAVREDRTAGVLVLALHRSGGRVEPNPASDTMLRAGDRLIVMGTVVQLENLTGSL